MGLVFRRRVRLGGDTHANVSGRRRPRPQPVQAVESLRLMPPEAVLAGVNRSLASRTRPGGKSDGVVVWGEL